MGERMVSCGSLRHCGVRRFVSSWRRGWQESPAYDGQDLHLGCKLQGPLVFEERTIAAFVTPRRGSRRG